MSFGLPKKLMVLVTDHSMIEERLTIADKHFSTAKALSRYSQDAGEYGRSGIDELMAIVKTWERLVAAKSVVVELFRANAAADAF